MDSDLKQKIRDSMTEHLKAKGWPEDLDNEGIIAELPRMWEKIEGEGFLKDLIARGFTYEHFVQIAHNKRLEVETLEEILMHFHGKRR